MPSCTARISVQEGSFYGFLFPYVQPTSSRKKITSRLQDHKKIKGCPYQEYLSVTEQTACLLSYEQMNPLMITDKAVSSVLFIFGSGLTILKKTPR